jgi:hypothetical protein
VVVPEEQLTPEQFMDNIKDWAPGPELKQALESRLKDQAVPEVAAQELTEAMDRCASATFRYLRLIHGYATTKELGRDNFLPALAELVEHLQQLRDAGFEYAVAFRHFDEADRPNLKSDEFDTRYFDVIQGLDLKEYLKGVLAEVAPVLKAMTLASAELKGVPLTDLFEQCIRYHLFIRYFLMSEKGTPEELWSLLFDLYNLLSGDDTGSVEVLLEDLDEMKMDLERLKRMN